MEEDIARLLSVTETTPCDVILLPELIGSNASVHAYENAICELALKLRCYVVGGSHYMQTGNKTVNRGIVANPGGGVVAAYEKLNPYGPELEQNVAFGRASDVFHIGELTCKVCICADLWVSDTFLPRRSDIDLVFVPSFSISQRSRPEKAQALWRHMTVARAYEIGAYVCVSDWDPNCAFNGLNAAGVAGLATPIPEGEHFFEPIGAKNTALFELDFRKLEAFREHKRSRGFRAGAEFRLQ